MISGSRSPSSLLTIISPSKVEKAELFYLLIKFSIKLLLFTVILYLSFIFIIYPTNKNSLFIKIEARLCKATKLCCHVKNSPVCSCFKISHKYCTVWTFSLSYALIFNLTLFKHRTFTCAHKTHRNPKQNLKTQLGSLLMSHLIKNKGNRKRQMFGGHKLWGLTQSEG